MPKYVVRYGRMRHLGLFTSRGPDRYARGHRVITRTGRGQESGEVLCEATEHVVSQMPADTRTGQILRRESDEDLEELARVEARQRTDHQACQRRIDELGLEMQLVDVERLYGGERIVFYYLAEGRVDFRELVKLLGQDLKTRVEMRQIGVRDEAKLLADYGDCGKPVCCNTHLSQMPPVSMKMAKLQRATLDPTKISGRCGRLKCCLRYEYDTYRELKAELPKTGHEVLTRDGRARVLAQEIITSELLVETESGRRVVIPASDVVQDLGKAAPRSGGKPAATQDPTLDRKDKRPPQARSKGPKRPPEPPRDQPAKPSEADTAKDAESEASPSKPPEASKAKRRRRRRRKPGGPRRDDGGPNTGGSSPGGSSPGGSDPGANGGGGPSGEGG